MLRDLLDQPLPMKIPVGSHLLTYLSSLDVDQGVIDKVFEGNVEDICRRLEIQAGLSLTKLLYGPSKESFHYLWDLMMATILRIVFPHARFDRYPSRDSDNMLYRPSLLFVVDGVCVFRGEETESYMNIEVARKELCANTLWSYGQVPCVFGYGYEKRYPHGHDLSHIESVYRALEIARVPNVVRLVELDLYDNAAIFEPHDKNGSPANLTELFIALRNVLEALVVLHREGWAHGDIRWSKVLKRRDRESWFLIDLDEATISPQRHPSGTYLTKDHHAAEVSQGLGNIHTAAADIWSVGQLIESCDPTVGWASCKRRMAFLKRLLANDPPTAQ